ncbi:hypothetical protein [Nitrosomonas ureae]|nr:hypothetical protein [Nitrosomonas ureae]
MSATLILTHIGKPEFARKLVPKTITSTHLKTTSLPASSPIKPISSEKT